MIYRIKIIDTGMNIEYLRWWYRPSDPEEGPGFRREYSNGLIIENDEVIRMSTYK